MKQHITIKQAHDELSKSHYKKAVEWLDGKGYIERYYDLGDEALIPVGIPFTKNKNGGDYAFMTIGQMIEFLQPHRDEDEHDFLMQPSWFAGRTGCVAIKWWFSDDQDGELCDALWEACREILDK